MPAKLRDGAKTNLNKRRDFFRACRLPHDRPHEKKALEVVHKFDSTPRRYPVASNPTKARAWIAGGSSDSDTALWPPVVQDVFEEKAIAAAAEARVVAAGAQSTRQELEALSAEFAKYKARAHTALKKATSTGADDKRKDEVCAVCVHHLCVSPVCASCACVCARPPLSSLEFYSSLSVGLPLPLFASWPLCQCRHRTGRDVRGGVQHLYTPRSL